MGTWNSIQRGWEQSQLSESGRSGGLQFQDSLVGEGDAFHGSLAYEECTSPEGGREAFSGHVSPPSTEPRGLSQIREREIFPSSSAQ